MFYELVVFYMVEIKFDIVEDECKDVEISVCDGYVLEYDCVFERWVLDVFD